MKGILKASLLVVAIALTAVVLSSFKKEQVYRDIAYSYAFGYTPNNDAVFVSDAINFAKTYPSCSYYSNCVESDFKNYIARNYAAYDVRFVIVSAYHNRSYEQVNKEINNYIETNRNAGRKVYRVYLNKP
jgi:hypothetical protein